MQESCTADKRRIARQYRDFVIDLRGGYLLQLHLASVELLTCRFSSFRSIDQLYSEAFVQRPQRQPEEIKT